MYLGNLRMEAIQQRSGASSQQQVAGGASYLLYDSLRAASESEIR